MKFKKQYGASKSDSCVYCQSPAYSKSTLKLPVCKVHKDMKEYPDYKCPCGDWVDLKDGKYGVYGLCLRCGPKNMNTLILQQPKNNNNSTSTTVSSPAKKKIDPTAYPLILD